MMTPVIQAPMAGAHDERLAIAVARGGGQGSLPCAMLTLDGIRTQVARFRETVRAPVNLNFFSHTMPPPDPAREAAWAARLAPYFAELGASPTGGPSRAPFDEAACAIVEAYLMLANNQFVLTGDPATLERARRAIRRRLA